MEYGYVRVSSSSQNIDRQMDQMYRLNLTDDVIFIDKYSGKDFNREAYQKMLSILKPGDLVYISSIDRLGRNYEMIVEEWRKITISMKVNVCVLDMPLLDTRRNRDLVESMLSEVILQILSYVAEEDRNNIRHRQAEGIKAARAMGIHLGRPYFVMGPEFEECAKLYVKKKISSNEAGERLGISRATFYKYLKIKGYSRLEKDIKKIPNARGRKRGEKKKLLENK